MFDWDVTFLLGSHFIAQVVVLSVLLISTDIDFFLVSLKSYGQKELKQLNKFEINSVTHPSWISPINP